MRFIGRDAVKIICAWCGKVLREGTLPASHGICRECKRAMQAEADAVVEAMDKGVMAIAAD